MLKKLLLIALQKIVNLLFPKLRQNGLLAMLFALIDMLCCQLVAIELWIYSNITVTCLSGKFVEQAPSDESVSPPKITMSLSTNSVGDEKFLPKPPSCTLS